MRSPEDVWRAGECVDGSTFHHENKGEMGELGEPRLVTAGPALGLTVM